METTQDNRNLSLTRAAGLSSLESIALAAPSVISVDTLANSGNTSELKAIRNIRGIIFDFDGTLFDNVGFGLRLVLSYPPDILRIWRERLVRKRFAGRDFFTPEKYYRAFFGLLSKISHRSSQFMRHWYFKYYMPRMVRVIEKYYKCRTGLKELIEKLDNPLGSSWGLPAGFPAISIYSDYPFLHERLSALGLRVSPKLRLYGPESFGAQKPASRPFRTIAQDMGIRPDETLVIGDRVDTDGCGAFSAGMRFLCLHTGRRRYYKFDPYRNSPEFQHKGPILPMYSATWDELRELFRQYWKNS